MRGIAGALVFAGILSACLAKTGHFQAIPEATQFVDSNGEVIDVVESWSDLATEVSFAGRQEDYATVSELLAAVAADIRTRDISESDEQRITEHFGAQQIDIVKPQFYVFSERKIEAAVSKLQSDINIPEQAADSLVRLIRACEERHRLDYLSYQTRLPGLQIVALVAVTCTDQENIQLFWSFAQYTTALRGKEFSSTFRQADTADRFRSLLIRNMIKPAVPCKKRS